MAFHYLWGPWQFQDWHSGARTDGSQSTTKSGAKFNNKKHKVIMNEKFSYDSTGLVFGNLWGGGEGSYTARKLHAETLEDLIKQANKGLDGSIDSGMGFESLIGAVLFVTKTTVIMVNEKPFSHKEVLSPVFVGDLTEEQKDFLFEHAIYM